MHLFSEKKGSHSGEKGKNDYSKNGEKSLKHDIKLLQFNQLSWKRYW